MAITVKVGTYAHPDSFGMVEPLITLQTILDVEGKRLGIKYTWTINGVIKGSGSADIKTKLTALKAAYIPGKTLQIVDGLNVLEQLVTGNCKFGTRLIVPPSFPESRGSGQFASNRKFTATYEGDVYDSDPEGIGEPDVIEIEETTEYATSQDDIITRTVSGRLRTNDGVSAYTKALARDPGTPGGYNRASKTVRRDDIPSSDTRAEYSFVDMEYWEAFPAGATSGRYSDRISKDGMGEVIRVISGSFTGIGALAAAQSKKLSLPDRLLSEAEVTNPMDGGVDFTYTYLSSDSTNTLSFQEETELQESLQGFVLRPVLDAATPPIKQSTILQPARATQSGSAVGRLAYPAFPALKWNSVYLKTKTQKYGTKQRTRTGGTVRYPITWSYSFEFPTTPAFEVPSSPPAPPA